MSQPRVGASFGRYRIDRQLGMGGMGVVFGATDLQLDRPVALKVISGRLAADDEFLIRFHREAEILARLDSPHVIKVLDHGAHEAMPFIATPLVAGGDLDQLVRERGTLPADVAAGITAQIAEALAATHAVGVVHRDVKPANVLVHDPAPAVPHIYLCDFGIAQSESQGLTVTGARIGTWSYLAPERHQGAAASVHTDIYALGCVLWKLLTCRAPYAGSDVEIALAHIESPIPQLPGRDPLTQRMNGILRTALAKDPLERYPDAAAFRDDLTAARALSPGMDGARTVAAGQAMPVRRRRRTVGAAVVSLVALVVAATAAYLALRDGAEPPQRAGASSPPSGTEAEEPVPVAGDLDGDGHGDLTIVASTDRGARISTYLFDGTAPGEPRHQSVPDDDVLRGDFDGDKISEVAYVDGLGSDVEVGVFRGDGSFEHTTSQLPRDTDGVLADFALGDFDGDGRDDILATFDHPRRPGTTQFSVARSTKNGIGDFRPWFQLKGWLGSEVRAMPGDFDGKGPDDLALALEKCPNGYPCPPSTLSHLRSNGRAFIATSGRTPVLLNDGRKVRAQDGDYLAADFDGDGDDELAYVDGFRDPGLEITVLDVMVHDFDSRFTSGRDWAAGLDPDALTEGLTTTGLHFAPSDVDGDGRADLLVVAAARRNRLQVLALHSTGSGVEPTGRWSAVGCQDEPACQRAYAAWAGMPPLS